MSCFGRNCPPCKASIRPVKWPKQTVCDMRSLRRWALVCSLVAIPSLTGLVLRSSAGTLSGTNRSGELHGVAAVSSTNAWGAGNYYLSPSDLGDFQAVTEHMRGSTWSCVSSPSPPSHIAALLGVSPVSSTDVWAVG